MFTIFIYSLIASRLNWQGYSLILWILKTVSLVLPQQVKSRSVGLSRPWWRRNWEKGKELCLRLSEVQIEPVRNMEEKGIVVVRGQAVEGLLRWEICFQYTAVSSLRVHVISPTLCCSDLGPARGVRIRSRGRNNGALNSFSRKYPSVRPWRNEWIKMVNTSEEKNI